MAASAPSGVCFPHLKKEQTKQALNVGPFFCCLYGGASRDPKKPAVMTWYY